MGVVIGGLALFYSDLLLLPAGILIGRSASALDEANRIDTVFRG